MIILKLCSAGIVQPSIDATYSSEVVFIKCLSEVSNRLGLASLQLLKSAVQKNVRLCRSSPAMRASLHLMKVSMNTGFVIKVFAYLSLMMIRVSLFLIDCPSDSPRHEVELAIGDALCRHDMVIRRLQSRGQKDCAEPNVAFVGRLRPSTYTNNKPDIAHAILSESRKNCFTDFFEP